MILVDSSVWIDFFRSAPGSAGIHLRYLIEESEPLALTGLVVTEVLQGLIRDAGPIARFLVQWDMLDPRGFETYREAAAIYRTARSKGISLTTIDTLIAAIALEHRATVFTLDDDFTRIAAFMPLKLYSF